MKDRIYNAIILNEPYAGWVKEGKKTIETRMKRIFKLAGDIVICCDKGKSQDSKNAGRALCIVESEVGRYMTEEDGASACIECFPGRIAYQLKNRRLFSYDFLVADYAIPEPGKRNPNWQGIFKIRIPDYVQILLNKEQEDKRSVATTDEKN